jgi:hypothetical protein
MPSAHSGSRSMYIHMHIQTRVWQEHTLTTMLSAHSGSRSCRSLHALFRSSSAVPSNFCAYEHAHIPAGATSTSSILSGSLRHLRNSCKATWDMYACMRMRCYLHAFYFCYLHAFYFCYLHAFYFCYLHAFYFCYLHAFYFCYLHAFYFFLFGKKCRIPPINCHKIYSHTHICALKRTTDEHLLICTVI